ncbi:hypothetical protein QBC34DRAFT_382924 [Podospora aff. communis PSN243]|uniref:Uncharacterized protein n=1 Tax=Podospora aff. communis PSN243 TaxID=3040156 RepID=A0AAV9GG93_9PEZI|nr:hypothetical protein QBC34DRAFT_382924 [Podospora aff. communis PSN243]
MNTTTQTSPMRRSRRSGRPKPFNTIENLQARWGDPPTTFDAAALMYLCRGLIREFNLRPRAVRRNLRIRAEWMRICRLLCDVGNVLSTENRPGGSRLEVDFSDFVKAGSDGCVSDTTAMDTPSESTDSENDEEKAYERPLSPSRLELWCMSRRSSACSVDLGGSIKELAAVVEEVDSSAEPEVCVPLEYKIWEAESRIEESEQQLKMLDVCPRDLLIGIDSRTSGERTQDCEKWDEKSSEDQQKQGPSNADSERRENAPNTNLVLPGCSTKYPTKLRMRVPSSSRLPRKTKTADDKRLKGIAKRTWRLWPDKLDEKLADV